MFILRGRIDRGNHKAECEIASPKTSSGLQ